MLIPPIYFYHWSFIRPRTLQLKTHNTILLIYFGSGIKYVSRIKDQRRTNNQKHLHKTNAEAGETPLLRVMVTTRLYISTLHYPINGGRLPSHWQVWLNAVTLTFEWQMYLQVFQNFFISINHILNLKRSTLLLFHLYVD